MGACAQTDTPGLASQPFRHFCTRLLLILPIQCEREPAEQQSALRPAVWNQQNSQKCACGEPCVKLWVALQKICLQVHEGLLTAEEADECISIEFNPVRAGFHGSHDVWTRDVLNLGVKPDKLIAKVGQSLMLQFGKPAECCRNTHMLNM